MRQGVPSSRRISTRALCLFRVVGGDAHVEGFALPDGGVERAHRLLERRLRIEAVTVEDVHVLEPHALEGGVQAGEQIFARAPFAVGTGPHVIARLGGDDELVAVGMKILFEQCPEGFLGGAGWRTVVVGEVEMRDAEIEGAAGDGTSVLEPVHAAEVVPPAQRDGRQFQIRCTQRGCRSWSCNGYQKRGMASDSSL